MADDFTYKVRGFFGRIPSEPHLLTDRITPVEGCIVLCHLGVLDVTHGDDWTLEIAGLVETPASFSVGQLKSLPKTEVVSVHQCAGSPLAPDKPTQRVCNVRWAGVRLDHVLGSAGVARSANFVWSQGADSGDFGGIACGHYIKDLPLSRISDDVLLAYEMNGAPLLPEHGYPLRLVSRASTARTASNGSASSNCARSGLRASSPPHGTTTSRRTARPSRCGRSPPNRSSWRQSRIVSSGVTRFCRSGDGPGVTTGLRRSN